MSARNRTLRANMRGPRALASIASATVAFAVSRGLTLDEIEEVTGLHGLDLMDPDARLPDDIMPSLWLILAERSRENEALPLEMARAAPFSFLGGLAHCAQFAKDLREALGLLVENKGVLADRLQLELIEDGTEAALVASHPLDSLDNGNTAKVGLGVTARLVSEILEAENCVVRVEFAQPPSGPPDAYRTFFRSPVLFEQPRTALIFHRTHLDTPVSQANAELFAYVQVHFDQIRRRLERDQYPAALAKLRRAIIDNSERGEFSAASAVASARLSLRSAQRLAAAHGTSLQELIDDVRAANAKALLSDPEMHIETVALLVGYAEDRSFRRAFKRWTGQTPSEFRKGARTPQA